MVKRYTVSVSDELAERIEKMKHKVSPSSVFQAAMEEKITKEEGFQKRLQEDVSMEEVIKRLKREKSEAAKSWHEKGREYGIDSSKYLDYETITTIIQSIPNGYVPEWTPDEILMNENIVGSLAEELEDTFKEFDSEGDTMTGQDGNLTHRGYNFLNGVLDGIQDFWDKVKDKL